MKQTTAQKEKAEQERDLEKLVDEIVEIEDEFERLGVWQKLKRLEKLKGVAKEYTADRNQEEEVTLKGSAGELVYSRCRLQRVVTNKKGLKRMLGVILYDELAEFQLRKLRTYLNGNQLDRVTEEEYGPRYIKEVKVYPKTVH